MTSPPGRRRASMIFGAYIQPPQIYGLDLPPVAALADKEEACRIIAERALQPVWECEIDGYVVLLTHGGAVHVEMPASWSPGGAYEEGRQTAADLANLLVCELTLHKQNCTPLTAVDFGSSTWGDDGLGIWVASRHYAAASMALDRLVRKGDEEVSLYERVPLRTVEALGDLFSARALRHVAVPLPRLVAAAVSSAHRTRQEEALLFSWIVCELLMNWVAKQHAAAGAVAGKDGTDLRADRSVQASRMLEILATLGVVDAAQKSALDATRRARNDLAHAAKLPDAAAWQALESLQSMLDAFFAQVAASPPADGFA